MRANILLDPGFQTLIFPIAHILIIKRHYVFHNSLNSEDFFRAKNPTRTVMISKTNHFNYYDNLKCSCRNWHHELMKSHFKMQNSQSILRPIKKLKNAARLFTKKLHIVHVHFLIFTVQNKAKRL